jgi:hypothetical protein
VVTAGVTNKMRARPAGGVELGREALAYDLPSIPPTWPLALVSTGGATPLRDAGVGDAGVVYNVGVVYIDIDRPYRIAAFIGWCRCPLSPFSFLLSTWR